ncbi:hypothetical protein DXG01_014037, partial [Tephrocybe rancida]
TVHIRVGSKETLLRNQHELMQQTKGKLLSTEIAPVLVGDGEAQIIELGDEEQSPLREVLHIISNEQEKTTDEDANADTLQDDSTHQKEGETRAEVVEPQRDGKTWIQEDSHRNSEDDNIWVVLDGEEESSKEEDNTEMPTDELGTNESLFTRLTDPFKECVNEILRLVTVGDDLSETEREAVRNFIIEYADVFALSVSEVKPVKGAVHKLHIKPDAKFSTKIHQKPLTPPQKKYLHTSIDDMIAAGIIEQCDPSQVKCVSPTTLAQKAHQGKGLALEELQHRVND